LVRAQIEAVASDFPIAALKSGMLANAGIICAVADTIGRLELRNFVLDPVMVATSGDLLIEGDAVAAIQERLIPLADVVTPNADEAAVLTGFSVTDRESMLRAAESIATLGARAVLIKGGHVRDSSGNVTDLQLDGEVTQYNHQRKDTTSTHGTGCTLSAAIAARLALGDSLREAVGVATDFVHEALRTAPPLGHGNGPLNHFAGRFLTNSFTSD
jgi:hydroxymethylpyrimidine kinase/phosphomethylpyrimidine kinase